MSETSWDAVVFSPKVSMTIMGFSLFKQYEDKDFTMTWSYAVDDDKADDFSFDVNAKEMLKDGKYFFLFEKMGVEPVDVAADSKFHIMAKIKMKENDTYPRFRYGYSGDNPELITGQAHMFKMEYSSYNNNSTSADWGQFGHIIYSCSDTSIPVLPGDDNPGIKAFINVE